HRVLQDHRDPSAADPLHLALALLEQIVAVEAHAPAHDARSRPRHQPEHRQARHALARARLADEAERLALAAGERDAVDRLDGAPTGDDMGPEVLDLDDRRAHARRRSAASPPQRWRSGSRPSASCARMSPTAGTSANPWPEKPAATRRPSTPLTGPSSGISSGVKASMPAQLRATVREASGG